MQSFARECVFLVKVFTTSKECSEFDYHGKLVDKTSKIRVRSFCCWFGIIFAGIPQKGPEVGKQILAVRSLGAIHK